MFFFFSFYLFLVLVYVFDLGVVHWQVPAVGGVPHAVAAGAQQGGLPLGGHGLQRGENRVPPGAAAQRLAYAQVQGAVLVNVQTGALRVGWVGGVRGQVRGQVVACCGREIVGLCGEWEWREGGDRERESLIKVAVSDFICANQQGVWCEHGVSKFTSSSCLWELVEEPEEN